MLVEALPAWFQMMLVRELGPYTEGSAKDMLLWSKSYGTTVVKPDSSWCLRILDLETVGCSSIMDIVWLNVI